MSVKIITGTFRFDDDEADIVAIVVKVMAMNSATSPVHFRTTCSRDVMVVHEAECFLNVMF